MRRFSSYGPVDTEEHYYAPRKELIEKTYTQLTGYNPQKSGHYFTVWAPRQSGKTWLMQQILSRLQQDPRFDVLKINLETQKDKNAPRRKDDLKIYEAVYHFNLFLYLSNLLKSREVDVIPEFPTGNGKIDLVLKYREKTYALELKSFRDMYSYEKSIDQAAEYGRRMGLKEIALLVFVELSEEEAKQLEQEVDKTGIKVIVLAVGIL